VGKKPAMKIVFTVGSPYDPAVITAMVFTAGSFVDPVVKKIFTADFCATVPRQPLNRR
jgi:hypothetical protein